MYMSGVLGQPIKPIPEIDNETMRDIKGFDKWSFQKGAQMKSVFTLLLLDSPRKR